MTHKQILQELESIEQQLDRIRLAVQHIREQLASQAGTENLSGAEEKKTAAPSVDQPAENNPEILHSYRDPKPEILEKFLEERDITIRNIPAETEADLILDKAALFLGRKFQYLDKYYGLLKRNTNTAETIRYNLNQAPPEKIGAVTQFSHILKDLGFLETYHYKNKTVTARVARNPKAINFLNGMWLERYIKKVITDMLDEKHIPYDYIKNPQIILPNGRDSELDLLFRIGDEIFWLETKTGDYNNYIDQYSRLAKKMDLDVGHSIMVLLKATPEQKTISKDLYQISLIGIKEFPEVFPSFIEHLTGEA